MKILITGAAGFLGRRLTHSLAENPILKGPDGQPDPVSELVLADVSPIAPPSKTPFSITCITGDLSDPDYLNSLNGFDGLFHLASLLTLETENNPARGFAVNVEALRRLMDGAQNRPKVVFTSSIAIYGGDLPETVSDGLNPVPTTTYGSHKAINELLIADYTRHKRVDGRALRLPIVVTRPGAAQPAVSDRVAGLLREPLNGVDVTAPFKPETLLPLASAGTVVAALRRVHDIPTQDLPLKRAFNLPALSVTVDQIAAALARHGANGQLSYAPEAEVQAIVDGWPRKFTSNHADRLGIVADTDIDALITDYLGHRHI